VLAFGRAQGPLVGGMLNRLVRVQATPYALSPEHFDGAILFWEEVGTYPPNVPMPLGVPAEVDADAVTLTLLEPAVTAS
jgi:muramoyltetrapeptide carboxypeptidase LdcA involved in peptidoglycan recycling